jgi:hypothetical protein
VSWILPPNFNHRRGKLLRERWGVVMGRIRKKAAREAALPEVDHKIQEDRQRIAELLVRKLEEVGFDCSLGDNSLVPRRDN